MNDREQVQFIQYVRRQIESAQELLGAAIAATYEPNQAFMIEATQSNLDAARASIVRLMQEIDSVKFQ